MVYEEYERLAVHNSACNVAFYRLQDCERDYPLRRMFGKCSHYHTLLRKCIANQGKGPKNCANRFTKKKKIMPDNKSITCGDKDLTSGADDNDGYEFPDDNDVCDMLREVPLNSGLPTITDRYFVPYYKINVQKDNDDICIRIHSNRICMLSLAPSHALLQNGCKIEKVSFKVTDKLDRTVNKVTGKGKHGAQPMQANSNVCIITCTNGEVWSIKCCISGKLIEVNESLIENPELIKELPHKGGYIAIILPNIKTADCMKDMLLTEDDYKTAINKRKETEQLNGTQNENIIKRTRDEEVLSSDRPEKLQKL